MTWFKGRDKVKSCGGRASSALATARPCRGGAQSGGDQHAVWSDGAFYVGDPAADQADAALRAHDKARKLLGAHR